MPDATVKFENARFIITMDPERRIIANGSVVVQGQRILQVGKAGNSLMSRRNGLLTPPTW